MTAIQRSRLIQRGADLVDILEAAYAPEANDEAWLSRVVAATERVLHGSLVVGMQVMKHEESFTNVRTLMVGGVLFDRTRLNAALNSCESASLRALYYSRAPAMTHSETWPHLGGETRTMLRDMYSQTRSSDVVGILAHPEPGIVGVLYGMLPDRHALAPRERRVLSRVALHVESALRLRRRPEALVAVLSPEGKLLHREAGAPSTEALAVGVKTIERARLRSERTQPNALDVWRALVSGQVSLVERESHGTRHYFVLENAPTSGIRRVLSHKEASVLALAARGLTGKLVAYTLGLSSASVSRHLASATTKLGLTTPAALLGLASRLTIEKAPLDTEQLTPAEHEILELLRAGLSNRAIAARRQRSERTVANQVAALLRKTGSPSRRKLVTSR